jgi:hypothetical protein
MEMEERVCVREKSAIDNQEVGNEEGYSKEQNGCSEF